MLQQHQMSLHEYAVKFRRLEKYGMHVYQTDIQRANKFVRGLNDELRSKVMTSRPQDLDDAIDMATQFEEDLNRTNEINKRHEAIRVRTRPNQFKRTCYEENCRGDVFKRFKPALAKREYVCPKCRQQHLRKSYSRDTGACLHCSEKRHFIRECPKKRETECSGGNNNPLTGRRVLERVYVTTVEELKSNDLIEECSPCWPTNAREEQEEIVMTSSQSNLLNTRCPISGKPVGELDNHVCRLLKDPGSK